MERIDGMTGLEAFIAATEGKKVRRVKYPQGYYCIAIAYPRPAGVLFGDRIRFSFVMTYDGKNIESCFDKESGWPLDNYSVNAGEFMHDDWEVVE
jgi:hypothetical protein